MPLGIYQYAASFDGATGGERLALSLERVTDIDAIDSYVEIPQAFELDGPGTAFSRSEGLTVSWSGDDDATESHVRLDGACVEAVAVDLDGNPGLAVIQPFEFVPAAGVGPEERCLVTVEVLIENEGVVDPAFGRGGTVRAYQTRAFEIESVP